MAGEDVAARRVDKQPRRTQPHNLDAEISILGGILLDNAVMLRLAELETDHFYDPRNKVVFGAMRALEAKSQPIDTVTVEAEIEAGGKLEAIGGVAYLGECAMRVPTPENVMHYAEIVRMAWRWRDAMHDLASMLELGYTGDYLNTDPILEIAEIAARAQRAKPSKHITLGDAVTEEVRRVNDLVARRDAGETVFSGLPFGFRDVDAMLGGAPFGTTTLLLGLRGGAKTTGTQCIAEHAAATMARASKGVVVYCYNEDTPAFFAQRSIAASTRGALSTESIGRLTFAKQGEFSRDGFAMFNAAGQRVAKQDNAKLILLKTSGMDGLAVGRLLLQIHAELGLSAFVMDYLQRMRAPKGITNKAEAIGLNSHELGNVAVETNAACILNAQLDPGIADREWDKGGPIPQLGDTRWSKDPEADARVILALFDRWTYGKLLASGGGARGNPEPGAKHLEPLRRDVIELHCLKRTMGDPDIWWKLQWLRESHWIGDLERRDAGVPQMTLMETDDEAWRSRMPPPGKGDHHP